MSDRTPIRFGRATSLLLRWAGLAALTIPDAAARAGGGGGGVHRLGTIIFCLIVSLILSPYLVYVNRRINKKKRETEQLLNDISQKDPGWNEPNLEDHVRNTFYQIQEAWCQQDLAALQNLLHPQLFEEWKTKIEIMRAKGERNILKDLCLMDVRLVEAQNYRDNEKDAFTACIDAEATDRTIRTNGALDTSDEGTSAFREFWTYQRHQETWLLLRIDQTLQWRKSVNAELINEE
jgi:predicted lipid-binding transport protein (Tim44 family)